MVNTNFGAQNGASAIVVASSRMMLLCGPLFWDDKQADASGNTEKWGAQRPTTVRIRVRIESEGLEGIDGYTGILDRDHPPANWAIALPLSSQQLGVLQGLADEGAKVKLWGEKDYGDYEGPFDEREWREELSIVVLPASVAAG